MPPYYLASPDDTAEDDSGTTENTVSQGYDDQSGQPEDQEPPPWPGAPYASPQPQPGTPATAENGETVTLIFKDGRTPEEIHNYLLTKDILYVGDQYHRQIPIDQLDLAATVQVNRDLGVDFRLPNGSR
jgi:hypothetical protein